MEGRAKDVSFAIRRLSTRGEKMVGRKLFRRVKGSVDERRFRLGYRINRKCIREGGGGKVALISER